MALNSLYCADVSLCNYSLTLTHYPHILHWSLHVLIWHLCYKIIIFVDWLIVASTTVTQCCAECLVTSCGRSSRSRMLLCASLPNIDIVTTLLLCYRSVALASSSAASESSSWSVWCVRHCVVKCLPPWPTWLMMFTASPKTTPRTACPITVNYAKFVDDGTGRLAQSCPWVFFHRPRPTQPTK